MGKSKSGKGGGSGGGGGGNDDNKHEQKFQAVLLTDSFTQTFRPISFDKPRVLCPLNNVALIDYSIEFLASAGVEELFVFCTSDDVESYVENHIWSTSSSSSSSKNDNTNKDTSTAQITSQSSSRMMDIICVKDSSITNAGDALRELDKKNLVKSDPFILMHGDIVTNVDIQPAIIAHKERHKKDNSAMMTILFKRVGGWKVPTDGSNNGTKSNTKKATYSSLRTANDDLVVGFDPTQSNRILLYDDHKQNKSVSLPCSFLKSHPDIDLRCDLLDCGIDVCSPDVLARFSDEFDYRNIRNEFVSNSVAEEEEGLQNKIFAHFLSSTEYAARVHDFASYGAISRDILQRWCYPIVPDNLPSGYEKKYCYALQRHNLYKEMKCGGKTKIGRTSIVKGPGIIGSQCLIGDECQIERTVIGSNCKIMNNVSLIDSYLWDNVTIEKGATVIQSILANNCTIKSGATIGRGCIIGQGCIVGSNVVLPEFTRLTLSTKKNSEDDDWDDDDWDDSSNDDDDDDDDDDDESWDDAEEDTEDNDEEQVNEYKPLNNETQNDEQPATDHNIVGSDGLGRLWVPSSAEDEEEDSDEEDEESPLDIMKSQSIGYDPTTLYQKRFEDQTEDDDELSDKEDQYQQAMDFDNDEYGNEDVTYIGIGTPGDSFNPPRNVDVIKEFKAICMEHETSSPIENLAIELNSFKFSQNATYSDITMAATLAILERMKIESTMGAGALVKAFADELEHWAPLLQKMSISLEDEKNIISALETSALDGGEIGKTISKEPAFRLLLDTLYNKDVVSESAILSWAADRKAEENRESPLIILFQQKRTQEYLEWLEESDDDDEDDDSDEEDDSEDDD